MQKHVFVGQVKDVSIFYEAQSEDQLVTWAIPTTARFGDKGVFLLPRVLGKDAAFVSVGVISSQPKLDNNRWTKWGAQVRIISFEPAFEPVDLPYIQREMSNWGAIQYLWDRSFQIETDFEFTLTNLLKFRQGSAVASQFAQSFY